MTIQTRAMNATLNLTIRGAFAVTLLMAGAACGATNMYKCVSGGKTTFSSAPCKSGRMTEVKVVNSSNTTVRHANPTVHERKVAAILQREQAARLAIEEQQARASAADAVRAARCNVLRAEQDSADAEAQSWKNIFKRSELREKARTHRVAMAAECPG